MIPLSQIETQAEAYAMSLFPDNENYRKLIILGYMRAWNDRGVEECEEKTKLK